jgi:ferritin-like metal-binding protein YciE
MPDAPQTLKDLYTADLRDLWSANDQMQQVVQQFTEKASHPKLRQLFEQSVTGIAKHTQKLRQMSEASTDSICKAMEGMVAEANQHALKSDLPPALRDLEMITQYQRMSHYGMAGFGTVAAYAEALGLQDQASQLKSIVADIYKADEYATTLAEAAQEAAKA